MLYLFIFVFRIGFRPINDERLIRLMRRGMRTGQALFPLRIEPGISQIRPWKELMTFLTTLVATFSCLTITRIMTQDTTLVALDFRYIRFRTSTNIFLLPFIRLPKSMFPFLSFIAL